MLTAAALVFMAAGNGARANDGQRATTAAAADTTAADSAPPHRRTLGRRILGYIANANKPHPDRKFDFSILGGPHYNTNTKLGLGLVAAGLYNTDRSDSLMRTSNVSLFGDVSTVGFYMLGVRGLHVAPRNRYRIDYTLYFYSFPSKFWGLGYGMGNDDANESDMNRFQAQAKASFLWRVAPNLYFGPMAAYDFVRGLSPYPAAWCEMKDAGSGKTYTFKVYETAKEPCAHGLPAGQVESDGRTYLKVAVDGGFLHLKEIQLTGKKRMRTEDFLRGFRTVGELSMS